MDSKKTLGYLANLFKKYFAKLKLHNQIVLDILKQSTSVTAFPAMCLPLKYVWFDGKENKSWPTKPVLPTGEPLNGSQAYLDILSYFTTNSLTPLNVSNLGREQLNIFYPQVSLN